MVSTIICFIVKKKYEISMLKKNKNLTIEDNSGCDSFAVDLHKRENVKINKTKVILKNNDQEFKDYILYNSISKL